MVACIVFSLYENISLFYKTSWLACNHFQIWGEGDNSILWLSFAQQKCHLGTYVESSRT
jgi:accessory colonization factor AcfC